MDLHVILLMPSSFKNYNVFMLHSCLKYSMDSIIHTVKSGSTNKTRCNLKVKKLELIYQSQWFWELPGIKCTYDVCAFLWDSSAFIEG